MLGEKYKTRSIHERDVLSGISQVNLLEIRRSGTPQILSKIETGALYLRSDKNQTLLIAESEKTLCFYRLMVSKQSVMPFVHCSDDWH